MAELDGQTPTPHAEAGRSQKLTKAVIWLAILPLVLPLPFYGIVYQWGAAHAPACLDFTCQALTDWERLVWLLVLGPSMLVAVTSILLGTIGLVRARRHPISFENKNLLLSSVVLGVLWAGILGCVFLVLFYLASIHD